MIFQLLKAKDVKEKKIMTTNKIVANALAARNAIDEKAVEQRFAKRSAAFMAGLKKVEEGLNQCKRVSGGMALDLGDLPSMFDGGKEKFLDIIKKLYSAQMEIDNLRNRM